MPERLEPIISRENLSKEQANLVATVATSSATETARRDAVKRLHSLMLAANPQASAKEMVHTAAYLAGAMNSENPKSKSVFAAVEMHDHLVRTGDLKPQRSNKRTSASPNPASDPSSAPTPVPIATSTSKKRKGIFGRFLGR